MIIRETPEESIIKETFAGNTEGDQFADVKDDYFSKEKHYVTGTLSTYLLL
ncbi:MAG: hypothetical protein OEZ36_08965 [Spirochaetota bacterium]|nr:hypothetical protein [Spirochaetota bacterium]